MFISRNNLIEIPNNYNDIEQPHHINVNNMDFSEDFFNIRQQSQIETDEINKYVQKYIADKEQRDNIKITQNIPCIGIYGYKTKCPNGCFRKKVKIELYHYLYTQDQSKRILVLHCDQCFENFILYQQKI